MNVYFVTASIVRSIILIKVFIVKKFGVPGNRSGADGIN